MCSHQCCLFCEITKENIDIKRSERGGCKLRTLASLYEDYIIQSGYNFKNAKCHNNEIAYLTYQLIRYFVIPFL